jgi:hypothetical protein
MAITDEPSAEPFDCQFQFITKIHRPEFVEQDSGCSSLNKGIIKEAGFGPQFILESC